MKLTEGLKDLFGAVFYQNPNKIYDMVDLADSGKTFNAENKSARLDSRADEYVFFMHVE